MALEILIIMNNKNTFQSKDKIIIINNYLLFLSSFLRSIFGNSSSN
ncbi:hypothetical protein ECP030529314_3100 [Escherichia coli p0305293.14]|nr:hypothetical protein EC2860050_3095 [Escherichia coli 2860050]EMW49784.1 hypothetical protein EC2770900_2992 [Escherichia coli 2770900]EMW73459.1 hypothetical protein EC2747800_3083 [Escherichia coli 2747800]EMX68466.1 hypothetical protein ECENVIRA101_3338 [Escherichia coli Envira 10/1]EMX69121.1 hypothetical protein ECENVIRA811_3284 [Escherichia coli Envira 8/11]EMZ83173.1 hypothetical protein ECP03052931_3130 [Escherichia coli p0305293.1]ENB05916.1 hypothetical protein EC2866350_2996 [Es